MDAHSSTFLDDRMLTCILKFHMSSGGHFGIEMSSDGLKVLDKVGGAYGSGQLSNEFDGCKSNFA